MSCPRRVRDLAGAAFGVLLLAANAGAQTTERVSIQSSGLQAGDWSDWASISADGQLVAFTSNASDLVPSDTNACWDVFLHDRASGITERVSVDSIGAQGNGTATDAALSADGRFIAFTGYATNLVSGDTNGQADIFVRDRLTGAVERASLDSSGGESDSYSFWPSLSSDGRFVVFSSAASNLVPGDTNGTLDVFVRDRGAGTTERVSVDSTGIEGFSSSYQSAISADGGVVAFWSWADNLDPNDTNLVGDIFVHDRNSGLTERVSVDSTGIEGDGQSFGLSLSADGNLVAFASLATNLVAGDTNATSDVFVHDRTTAQTQLVSVASTGAQGDGTSNVPALSADGLHVAFSSSATNLVAGDTNQRFDVFLHDLATGTTRRASVDSSGAQADDDSGQFSVALSGDGGVVAFRSKATNLVAGDTNGVADVFVEERCATAASWSNYGAGFPGTFGIPSFTSRQDPVFGATITLDLANSRQQPTVGLLVIGFQQTNLHSSWGGDLLVVPALILPISFSFGFDSFSGTIPDDSALCGLAIDLQALESDPGAAKGVSFTPGLELRIGR